MYAVIIFLGFYNLFFAVFHLLFWRLFKWNKEVQKLSFANRGIIQILNIQIIYYFVAVAIVCFCFTNELITTHLGKVFLLGNSLFWIIRLVQQYIFLRKNSFVIHILAVLFLLGAVLFFLPLLYY